MGKIYPGYERERVDEVTEGHDVSGVELPAELTPPEGRLSKIGAAKSVDPRGWVSVVIPARNEEQCIGEVIEKSLPFCDEIVVVDGHSIDRKVQGAESYGVRV